MSYISGKIIACLDIGTSKISCIIASVEKKKISILGYGYRKSRGISSSVITDMKIAEKSINAVVSDAEKMAGLNIKKIAVSLSGSRTRSKFRSITKKVSSGVIKDSDMSDLVTKIKNEHKIINEEIIHLVPLEYKIDDIVTVHNPKYMSGKSISAKFHIVSANITITKNIETCLRRCKLSVYKYISAPYSSILACLSESELNFGTLLIDIGGNSTSFSIIIDNKLFFTGCHAIGGEHITRDISSIVNIPMNVAEKIKILNNSLTISPIEESEFIKLKINSEDCPVEIIEITKLELRDIMKSRIEEILEFVKKSISKNFKSYSSINNIVITGGVASTIGIEKTAEGIFKKQATIGYPVKIRKLPNEIELPSFCGIIGMLVFLRNAFLFNDSNKGFDMKNNFLRKFMDYLLSE